MTDFDTATRLIASIARALRRRPAEGVDQVLARLAEQPLAAGDFRPLPPRRLPVLRHLAECTAASMLVDADVAAALAEIEDLLSWCQSPNYTDAALGPGFLDNHGWCELIGSEGFFPGDDFRLGVLLLGPHRDYKDHYHPAPELYWTLTGPSDWKKGAGGFESKPADTLIWHPHLRIHATRTGEAPLLAIWAWTEDVGTPTKLLGQ